MLSKTLINKFNESPHALHNDGSVEQLREVMKVLFPNDDSLPDGSRKYYSGDDIWIPSYKTTLPVIRVTEFFTTTEKTVKVSEVVYKLDSMYADITSVTNEGGITEVHKMVADASILVLNELKQYLNSLP